MRLHLRSGGWMKWSLVAMVLVASTALLSTTKSPFTERDKAFYADEAMVNFIRPGLVFKIVGQVIATDGTLKVRFKITDPKGVPLEREGINTPGVISTSFILAKIPNDNKFYQAYTTRTKTSTYPPTAGAKSIQAGADAGGTYAKVADGEYVYTFGYKLPAGYEKDATHSIAVYGSRNLTEFDMGTNYATDIYSFVPVGTPVVKVRDVFETASCNKCHDQLSFHGGSRVGVDICTMCHTPAYTLNNVTVANLNPETNNTIDLTVMAHKIHMGANLPSVKAGKPYQIVGFGNAISDWSKVGMPSGANNCQWCHEKGNDAATQKDAWVKNPTRTACGACHDNVNFNTGENHVGLPQLNDNQCANCHIPQGEIDFDASIKGAHVSPRNSNLAQGAVVKILSLENTNAGQKPTVTFSLTNFKGEPLAVNQLIPGAGRGRLGFTLAGPTTDYGAGIKGNGTNGYVQDAPAVTAFTGDPSAYKYTMSAAVPADAKGTWVIGIEGRADEKLLAGTQKERIEEIGITNVIKYFSVDGTPVAPRRENAVTATCNNCHSFLSLHGENRNQVETCVICHNPAMTDAARRPAAESPAEAISLASMVHRLHTASSQPNPYIIYGFGNSKNDFSDITLPPPASASNCNLCHSNGSQSVVPAKGTLKVTDPRGYIPSAGTTTAACLACHSSVDAASHALANTTTLGESCGACHGSTSEFSVNKVHAQ